MKQVTIPTPSTTPLGPFSFVNIAIFLLLFSFISIGLSSHAEAANTEEDENEKSQQEFNVDGDDELQKLMLEQHNDDLFEMIKRGTIRVMVTYSKTHYFIDQGNPHGLTHETLQAFEAYLNKRYKSRLKGRPLRLIPIPAARDQLLTRVEQGYADLAIANLTITPERKKLVNFSIPVRGKVSEVVVSSSSAPKLKTLDDISDKTFFVRASSSFYKSLLAHNEILKAKGLKPAIIIEADEHLEVEDLMEMANADLISYTVVDSHIAKLWEKIFDQVTIYPNLSLSTGQKIAWAVRKNTPDLIYEVNRFLKKHRQGTTFGNVLINRYLGSTYWAKKALDGGEQKRFDNVVSIFKTYADLYDFDHLMLLAQSYQESRLDHTMKSPVGALGIMQVMPKTGAAMNVGDIKKLENNIHAGSKYLRKLRDHYFDDPELDELNRTLFAFAAYNAGPTRIRRLRNKTKKLGLDPNVWFGNVEHTVARYIGRETVNYVANISKYHIAYRLYEVQRKLRSDVIESSTSE